MTIGRGEDRLAHYLHIGLSYDRNDEGKLLAEIMLDELATRGAELEDRLARLLQNAVAMSRPLTALEQATAELRRDVTRLGERVDGIEARVELEAT